MGSRWPSRCRERAAARRGTRGSPTPCRASGDGSTTIANRAPSGAPSQRGTGAGRRGGAAASSESGRTSGERAVSPREAGSRAVDGLARGRRGRTCRVSRAAARARAIAALEEVGIPSPHTRIDEYPYQFSGGMRQRVMIAMALICRPKLVIA
ncbi:MAG: ATP-binding cassette domain-containing protein, partial [Sandaracinaceae bacterium]